MTGSVVISEVDVIMCVVLSKAAKCVPCGELVGRVDAKPGGTRMRAGGEVKGKEANGVGSH